MRADRESSLNRASFLVPFAPVFFHERSRFRIPFCPVLNPALRLPALNPRGRVFSMDPIPARTMRSNPPLPGPPRTVCWRSPRAGEIPGNGPSSSHSGGSSRTPFSPRSRTLPIRPATPPRRRSPGLRCRRNAAFSAHCEFRRCAEPSMPRRKSSPRSGRSWTTLARAEARAAGGLRSLARAGSIPRCIYSGGRHVSSR